MRSRKAPKSNSTRVAVYPKRPPFRNPFPLVALLDAQGVGGTGERGGSSNVSVRTEVGTTTAALNLTAVRATATIGSVSVETAQPLGPAATRRQRAA